MAPFVLNAPFPLWRWVALCAAAETIGMSASAGAARMPDLVFGSMAGGPGGLALIVAGGLVEGIALGTLQSIALRRWLPAFGRPRWILVTLLVAGAGWAAASAPGQLATSGDSAAPPGFLMAIGALGLGAVMGTLLGAAQAGGFHGLVPHPWRWIRISTLAWAPTMAVIFLGASTPDISWTLWQVVLLGAATGAVAGAVLGLISGFLAPELEGHSSPNRVVTGILGSPMRGMFGRSLVVLRVRGRVSGRLFEIPVQSAVVANGLAIVPGRPERKMWWHNFAPSHRIDVLIDGRWRSGLGTALAEKDPDYQSSWNAYRGRWPRARWRLGAPIVVVRWDP